jgi:hypothetical protein
MDNAFVTYLGTDDFLPGLLVLHRSLRKWNPNWPLIALTPFGLSAEILSVLSGKDIVVRQVAPIGNPHSVGAGERRFLHTYTKLRIFELEEYGKVVYLDADMLICAGIEGLFNAPHLSAVIAGGAIPQNEHWKDLKSGLLIVQPDKELFNDMRLRVGSVPSIDGSDQGFLQSTFLLPISMIIVSLRSLRLPISAAGWTRISRSFTIGVR